MDVHELPTIDMEELIRLRIYERSIDVVSWVALGPQRQQVEVAARAPQADPKILHYVPTIWDTRGLMGALLAVYTCHMRDGESDRGPLMPTP
nr:hypothetical protein [Tanacetum cinerariifolium]